MHLEWEKFARKFAPLCLAALLFGCAAERMSRNGMALIASGQYEAGLAKLDEAARTEPQNFEFRTQLIAKRHDVINRLLTSAAEAKNAGRFEEAEHQYQRVLALDNANARAKEGLQIIAKERTHVERIAQAQDAFKKGDTDKAYELIRQVVNENPDNTDARNLNRQISEQRTREMMAVPTLRSLYKKPVTLEFREANLKMVFEVLSRTSGINFILDKDVRSDLKATLFLKQSSLEDAIDLLLATNQLEKKVLNQSSVLIYPNTAAKVKEYQDLIVKSFYLTNADVKQTANLVKTMLKTKDIFTDEKLNLLVIRDTPEAIQLAEKLVAMHDLAEPEVMLEVEVLEVQRSRLLDIGIQYPNQMTLTPLPSTGTTLTLDDLRHGGGGTGVTIPATVINLKKQDGTVNILANPRIRARNREKAKILIGDKVPVITTTSTSTGFVSESVQYVDVGLKLEVEPNVHLDDDVAIKVGLEVSSIVNQVRSNTGTLTYQIGTRNASTVLRLKDGETQVLAGLISDEDRNTASKIPGLGDLPVLGRLFSNHADNKQKTEIVLSITPRLVRNLRRPDNSGAEFWSGTEESFRTKPLALPAILGSGAPTAVNTGASTPFAAASGSLSSAAPQGQSSSLTQSEKGMEPAARSVQAPNVGFFWQVLPKAKGSRQVSVALRVNADSDLRSMPFQIGFDPKILRVVEVAEGEFFKQGGAKTNFTSNVDQVGGKIFVGGARTGDSGVKGEGSVVVVTFDVLGSGPRSQVTLLAATPLGANNKTAVTNLPPPQPIALGE